MKNALDGKLHDLRVVRSLDPGLDAEALKAAAQWLFAPGTKDGQPVQVMVTVELTFSVR
jgi:TonB family protein